MLRFIWLKLIQGADDGESGRVSGYYTIDVQKQGKLTGILKVKIMSLFLR